MAFIAGEAPGRQPEFNEFPDKFRRGSRQQPTSIPGRGQIVNKNDLVAAVAADADLSKADASKAVDSVFERVTTALRTGNDVRLVGFGTFSVTQRAATTGRNPRTGEAIQIPASKQPKFKAGKALKAAVN